METVMEILSSVKEGTLSLEEAQKKLQMQPYQDLDYASIDWHRRVRQNAQEVIYGASKTPEQILGIARAMSDHGDKNILITRMSQQAADYVGETLDLFYDATSRVGIVNKDFHLKEDSYIAVVCAGTSDLFVAEEAALTAECMGNQVRRIYDVGVAGIHRLLHRLEDLTSAKAVIAVAGMEGALASVVGGLVSAPVIAVPTSVGYGANFGGVSALLSMLNSCSSLVSVVNIDNGFGAGMIASRINHI